MIFKMINNQMSVLKKNGKLIKKSIILTKLKPCIFDICFFKK